jgi:TBC1 domain family protein 5
MSKINNEYLTRFNFVYEDPYKFFCDYLEGNITFSDIQKKCKSGKLNPETRCFIYKIFLNILPYNNPNSWKIVLCQKRDLYYKKLNTLLSKNENILKFINCHSIKGTKVYEELFALIPVEYKEILSLIKLDVDRTFQDLDLFHNNKIKELLTKILFVYSIDNPHPSYCQGMNEILGTLFLSFYPSLKFNKFSKEEIDKENNDIITNKEILYYFIVDEQFFEADLFTIYIELMSRNLTVLYSYNDDKYKNVKSFGAEDTKNLTLEDLKKSEESDLMKRIKKIFYIYLKNDQEYFELLNKSIEPNLFLLRWILCVLNREISLKNIFWIWDCILFYEFMEFTYERNNKDDNIKKDESDKITRLNFLDYICLAMIFDLKKELINSEPSVILCKFLKYPNEKNMKKIMKEAFKYSVSFNERNNFWDSDAIKNFEFI